MEHGPGISTTRLSAFRFFTKNNASSSNIPSSSYSSDILRPPTPPAKDSSSYSLRNGNASSLSLAPISPNGSHSSSRFLAKLGSLGRKSKKSFYPDASSPPIPTPSFRLPSTETSSISTADLHPATPSDGDGSISSPWNIQHHVHVDDAFVGLPPSWASALAERGFTQQDITSLRSQRQRPRQPNQYPTATNHDRYEPYEPPEPLLVPKPRSDSLRDSFSSSVTRQQSSPFTNAPIPDSPTSLSSHSQSQSASGTGSRPSQSQLNSSTGRNRALTPLRVVNSEPDERDSEDEDDDKLLSPPPAYKPPAGGAELASGSGSWTPDVKVSVPESSAPGMAPTLERQASPAAATLQNNRVGIPPPPTRPPPPIPPPTLLMGNPSGDAEEDDTPPPTPAKDYPPFRSPLNGNSPQQSSSVSLVVEDTSLSSTTARATEMPSPISEPSHTHTLILPTTRDRSSSIPPQPSRQPPPPPEDALQQQLELRQIQSRKPSLANKSGRLYPTQAQHPLERNGSGSRQAYTSPFETLLYELSGDEDDDEPLQVRQDNLKRAPQDEPETQIQDPPLSPRGLSTADGALTPEVQHDQVIAASEEEEVVGRISDVAPRLSLPRVSTGGGLGLDLGFDFGSSFADSLGTSSSAGHEPEDKEARKSDKRARELGLHVKTPTSPSDSKSGATEGQSDVAKDLKQGSSSGKPAEKVGRTISSYSRNTESSVSADPSPLWREIMRMVNPGELPGPEVEKPPVVDTDATNRLSITLPAPVQLPSSTATSPSLSTNLTPSDFSHSDRPMTDSAPPFSPSLFPVPPGPLVNSSAKRLSALNTPPPFPPPNYPLPIPTPDGGKANGHATTLSETTLHSIPDEPSDEDEDDPDLSRDSYSCVSEKVVMAEVLTVRLAKGKLQPVVNSVSARIPRSPGIRESLSTRSLRDRDSIKSSPSPSPAPTSPLPPTPQSSLNLPSPAPSPHRHPLPPSPSLNKFLGSSDDHLPSQRPLPSSAVSEGRPVLGTLATGLKVSPLTEAHESPRRSSPTVLEEWLEETDESAKTVDQDGANHENFPLSAYAESPLDPGLSQQVSFMPLTPSIIVHDTSNPTQEGTMLHELSTTGIPPALKDLAPYIRANVNPHTLFADLTPVAEGQYGPVYAARSTYKEAAPPSPSSETVVAIKRISLNSGLQAIKIKQLVAELSIMSDVRYEHILSTDDLYLELDEQDLRGTLWVQMELMERSLADVLPLYDMFEGGGRLVREDMIARFARDCLAAVSYLQLQGIAHRDVRSDNMLLSSEGVVKLADFANAVRVTPGNAVCSDVVGVSHWQAPEIRSGRYDPLQVDVWGVGATVWELVEGLPPFADIEDEGLLPERWPSFSQPQDLSTALQEFIQLCSNPPSLRPNAKTLLETPFIQSCCSHNDVADLLHLCREMEEGQS